MVSTSSRDSLVGGGTGRVREADGCGRRVEVVPVVSDAAEVVAVARVRARVVVEVFFEDVEWDVAVGGMQPG